MKMDAAVPSSATASCSPSAGRPSRGSPRGTGPSTATPWPARLAAQLTMIAPVTAISAPGIRRAIRRAASMTPMTPGETATVAGWARGSAATVCASLITVCGLVVVIPSMSGSCPAATWMPTPVRKPSSTVRDRKLDRKPSRASRASSSRAPVSRAASPASRT